MAISPCQSIKWLTAFRTSFRSFDRHRSYALYPYPVTVASDAFCNNS